MPLPLPACRALTLPAALVVLLAGALSEAAANERVIFRTNGPSFTVELNPTNDPNLTDLVDNFLQYVTSGRYNGVVINRAAEDFVIQLGGFRTDSLDPDSVTTGGFPSVESFGNVVTDADNDGQVDFPTVSNTRGTISLALSVLGPNSGSSSFFVNLTNNSFLDSQGFVPFARIVDMAPIDEINALDRVDLSQEAGSPGSLAYTDVPLVGDDGELLVIEAAALVPEPSTLLLALLGAAAPFGRRR